MCISHVSTSKAKDVKTYFVVTTILPHGGASISSALDHAGAVERAASDAAYYLGPDMYDSIRQQVDECCDHCHGQGRTHHTKGKRTVKHFTKRCESCAGLGVVNRGELLTINREACAAA